MSSKTSVPRTTAYYAPATSALRSRNTLDDPFRLTKENGMRYPYPQQQYIPQRLVYGPLLDASVPRSLLAYHGVGVGKTMVGLRTIQAHITRLREADLLKDCSKSAPAAIVFVPGGVLRSQWKAELKKFAPQLGMKWKELSNYVAVLTFYASKAAKDAAERAGVVTIASGMRDDVLRERFKLKHAHTLFLIDETHKGDVYEQPKKNGAAKDTGGIPLSAYLTMVSRICPGTRLLVLTATPTYDNLTPLQNIVDLLYGFAGMDGDKPSALTDIRGAVKNGNTDTVLQALELTARLFVSYVRGENPRFFPVRLAPAPSTTYPSTYRSGTRQGNDEIVRVALGANQLRAFHTQTADSRTGGVKRITEGSAKWRQALTCVRPTSSWIADLEANAPVLKHILERIDATKHGIVVVSFRYNDSLEAFTALLDARGFERRTTTDIKPTQPPFRQYISRRKGADLAVGLLRFAAESRNRNGRHVRVIVIMPRAATGTDLKNVRQFHVAEPDWSEDALDQVVGRAFRSNSHRALPQEQRNVVVHVYEPYATQDMWVDVLGKEEGKAMVGYKTGERTQEIMRNKKRISTPLLSAIQRSAFDTVLQIDRSMEDYDTAVVRAYPRVVDVFGKRRRPPPGANVTSHHPKPPELPEDSEGPPLSNVDKAILFKQTAVGPGPVDAALDVMVGVFRLYIEMTVEQLIQFTRLLALTAVDARHAAVAYYPDNIMFQAILVLCDSMQPVDVVTPSGNVATVRRYSTTHGEAEVAMLDVLECVDRFDNPLQRGSVAVTPTSDWTPIFHRGLTAKRTAVVNQFQADFVYWRKQLPASLLSMTGVYAEMVNCCIDRLSHTDILMLSAWACKDRNDTDCPPWVQHLAQQLRSGMSFVVAPGRRMTYKWDETQARPYETGQADIPLLRNTTTRPKKHAMFLQEGTNVLAVRLASGSTAARVKIGQFRDTKLRQDLHKMGAIKNLRKRIGKTGVLKNSEQFWVETAVRMGLLANFEFLRPSQYVIRKKPQK